MADTDNANTNGGGNGDGATRFGSCCEDLRDVLASDDFTPLIGVEENGILLMSVGCVEIEDEGLAWLDHAVLFCPFCGTKLQDRDEIEARTGD